MIMTMSANMKKVKNMTKMAMNDNIILDENEHAHNQKRKKKTQIKWRKCA